MSIADLVYIRPNNIVQPVQNLIGLVVKIQHVGRSKLDGSCLCDVLLNETSKVITISDIYFEIWRIE